MKKRAFAFIFSCSCIFTGLDAQLPETRYLLEKTNAAVDKISGGSYTLHELSSTVSIGEDSSKRVIRTRCYFKKISDDTMAGYKLASLRDNGYQRVYDGQELLTLTSWTKTLETTQAADYPDQIKKLVGDYQVFPFFKALNRMMQKFSADSMINKLKVTGVENLNGQRCYKLEEVLPGKAGANGSSRCFYIAAASFLPMRWQTRIVNVVGQSRTISWFDNTMSDFLPAVIPDSCFTKAILTGYNRETEYNPANDGHPNRLLAVGAQAPAWELPLVSGGVLKLSDLKGKIVVMDFWFKACSPCLQQMTDLEPFSKKYNKDEVVFISINTRDDPQKDKLAAFLQKRDIITPAVYNGHTIERLYQVVAAPALFVVDKNGKIIYTLDGHSDLLIADLSRILDINR